MNKLPVQALRTIFDTKILIDEETKDTVGMQHTLQMVARAAYNSFGADICVLVAMNPISNRIITQAVTVGELQAEHAEQLMPAAMTKHVLDDGPWLGESRVPEAEELRAFAEKEGICSTAAFALREEHDPQAFGVLYLHFRERQHFTTDDQQNLDIFAAHAASFLRDAWLHFHYREVERIEQEMNEDLASVEDLFKKLQMYLARVLDSSYSFLLAVHPLQGQTFNVLVNEGERIITTNNNLLSGGACQHALATKEIVIIRHLSQEIDTLPFRLLPIPETASKEFYIFLPLILRGDTFGVLSIQHADPHAYNERDIPALKLLANHMALALRNISLYTNLLHLNSTGEVLTDLLESDQLLQATIDKMREDTLADIITLYPYDTKRQEFILPPLIAGQLLSTRLDNMNVRRSDDIVRLMLQQQELVFARDSSTLYPELLQGDLSVRQGSFEERENIRSTAAATLRNRDEIIGVLFLNFRQHQRFDSPQKLFIAALTNYAAIAIKSAQFIGTLLQRRTHEREILERIDHALSHTLELEHVLMTILEQANTMVHADWAGILLYDKEAQVLEVKATIRPDTKDLQTLTIPLHDTKGITRLALSEKRAIRVDNVHDPEWRDLYIPGSSDLHLLSELDVPLIDGDEVVGILNFESKSEGAFSADDEKFLRVLAGQTVLAVKRAQDYDKQKRLAEEEAALNQISKEIIGQLDSGVSFRVILQHALILTNSTLGSLHVYDPEAHELMMVAEQGADADKRHLRLGLHQGVVGYVARTKKPLNIDPQSPRWRRWYIQFAPGTRSELAVPMMAGDEVRGVLNVESRRPHSFNKEHEKLLSGLANLAVVAQEHAERHQNALRERKRFELLYKGSQALGRLAELEQREKAFKITQDIAEEYGQQHVTILRRDMEVPEDVPASMVFTVEFNEDHYGYLVLSPRPDNPRGKVDRLFFDGLAQQLASTLYRLETTYSKREAEKRALSNEEMAWVGSLILEVTHQRGNNMGLIKSYVNDIHKELRLLEATSPKLEKKLGLITQSAQKMLAMNEDIVKVMSTVGTNATEPENLYPAELFQEVRNSFTKLPQNITLTLEECVPDLVAYGIRSIVVNILYNLVANAMNAMQDGGIVILRAYREDKFIAIEVKDNGNGIPEYLQKRIFELGYSGKGSTGFGLWSALRGARRNQGDLQLIASQPGQGSTFRLLLLDAENIAID